MLVVRFFSTILDSIRALFAPVPDFYVTFVRLYGGSWMHRESSTLFVLQH